jgi:retinol-binding protein 3
VKILAFFSRDETDSLSTHRLTFTSVDAATVRQHSEGPKTVEKPGRPTTTSTAAANQSRNRATCVLLLATASLLPLATTSAQSDSSLDAATRSAVLSAALKALNDGYVFPEIAAAMERDVVARIKRGEYDTVTSAPHFADLFTGQLRAVSHDKHIRLEWSGTTSPQLTPGVSTPRNIQSELERDRRESAFINFGFRRAERLRGNVGYLDLSFFDRPEFGSATANAAMTFLHNTDALIIDLRDNDGGRPEMVALLISYLVEKPTALTGIHWRREGRVDSSRTVQIPESLKYVGKNVYLLTSHIGTVSAAEAFAYDLHLLRRAVLVGEVSAGAANPGGMVRLSPHFQLFVPRGRAVSPITSTNWEGTGIKPDIEVPAATALHVSYLDALKRLESLSTDDERKRYLRSVIDAVEKDAR